MLNKVKTKSLISVWLQLDLFSAILAVIRHQKPLC